MTSPAPPDPPLPETHEPRIDLLGGDPTVVVASRQGRPNLPADDCPFCPGGLEAPSDYEVRAFPNRWPPLPAGRAEVVLYTADHDATFASLGPTGARRVVDLWAERTAELGRRDDVAYVLVFENRGAEVGATISHPHGQIYAYGEVPPRALAELERAELEGTEPGQAGQVGQGPVDEATLGRPAAGPDDERLVCRIGSWQAWVPHAAQWPYELLLAPLDPVPDLPSLGDDGRGDLAAVLVDALDRLDNLFDAPMPYMLWFHQRPVDGRAWPAVRVHAHVAPLWRSAGVQRFVAAAELGGGMYFNPVDPVAAASQLRSATAADGNAR